MTITQKQEEYQVKLIQQINRQILSLLKQGVRQNQ